jgi:dTDP-4-dehydrorhamnose reductase
MSSDFLVLGSTGMLGQALIKEIKQRNKTVIGIARKNADITLDITKDELLLNTIKEVQPKVIINTVAIVNLSYCEENPAESYLYNARASATLSRYCAANQIKYIYISTDHYFKGNKNKKHSEEQPVNLCNEYALTKYLGEELSLINEQALVVRTNIVGFRYNKDAPTFVEWAIKALENNEKMNLFNDFYTSSIDVNSFSKALYNLITEDTAGLINLASSDVSNKEEFISALANRLNLSLKNTTTCSMHQNTSTIKRNDSLGLDVSKAEKILAYKLPTLSEVINNLAIEYLNKK